jgi:5-enolpyruvylshikimate-3-phosphate synthase
MTRCRYVRMTCSMMKEFGCTVQEAGDSCWVVPCSGYNKVAVAVESCDDDDQRFVDNIDVSTKGCSPPRVPCQSSAYEIEPDASSATYFLAMAAVTGAYVLSLALYQASAVCSQLQTNNQPTKSSSIFVLSSLDPPPPPPSTYIRRSRCCPWPPPAPFFVAG